MNLRFLPLFNWDAGVIGAILMFAVFIALVVVLLLFIFKGNKKDS